MSGEEYRKIQKGIRTSFAKFSMKVMKGKDVDVIELDHVKKVYGTKNLEYVALKDISLKVKKGEFVSIIGPSGSGKTTLMNIIGTLDRPSTGRILLDGMDLSPLNDNKLALIRNQKIGFIFQSYNLVPYLSALENVVLPLIVEGRDTPENIEKAKKLLAELGLGEHMRKKPNELSGGMQQRVAIARALVNRPSLILADEPTGNLDSKTADTVLSLLLRICKENDTTMVIVTHDPEVAAKSERSIHMKDGLITNQIRNRR